MSCFLVFLEGRIRKTKHEIVKFLISFFNKLKIIFWIEINYIHLKFNFIIFLREKKNIISSCSYLYQWILLYLLIDRWAKLYEYLLKNYIRGSLGTFASDFDNRNVLLINKMLVFWNFFVDLFLFPELFKKIIMLSM